MKFGQLTENNKRNIFPLKLRRRYGREAGSRPIFVFQKKGLNVVKASGLQFNFNIFSIALNLTFKNKLYKL